MHPAFDHKGFLRKVQAEPWPSLELKARMRHISHSLHQAMDLPFPKAVEVLRNAAPQQPGFLSLYFPDYIEVYGQDDPKRSVDALHWLTRFSSSEFAIRPFILAHPEMVLKKLKQWTEDENEHVRRWCSEGCRPRLPWAMALPFLKKDPSPILPILDALKNDESEYVRRSVANNLNDISKDHPELVVKLAREWKGVSAETDKVLKHATRTLLKKGDTSALKIFGFKEAKNIVVEALKVTPTTLHIGGHVHFSFTVKNTGKKPADVRTEYVVHFVKANGSSSPKVFQVAEKEIAGVKVSALPGNTGSLISLRGSIMRGSM